MSKKEAVSVPNIKESLHYSAAIRHGDVLYVSGQVGFDENGNLPADIRGQTRVAILNAKKIAEAAGTSLDNTLMCQCFIHDQACFLGMNEVYAEFFGGEHNIAPARYTVVAPTLDDEVLFEIAMIIAL